MRKYVELEAELRALAPDGSASADELAACQLILTKEEMDDLIHFQTSPPAGWGHWVRRALIVCSDYIPF